MYLHLLQWCTCISRVSDQNGVSPLYVMLEIHHSGWEPSICFCDALTVPLMIYVHLIRLFAFISFHDVLTFTLVTSCTSTFDYQAAVGISQRAMEHLSAPATLTVTPSTQSVCGLSRPRLGLVSPWPSGQLCVLPRHTELRRTKKSVGRWGWSGRNSTTTLHLHNHQSKAYWFLVKKAKQNSLREMEKNSSVPRHYTHQHAKLILCLVCCKVVNVEPHW